MSWQDYVDKQLLASRCVTKAAIAGHDGNIWAKSEGFDVSVWFNIVVRLFLLCLMRLWVDSMISNRLKVQPASWCVHVSWRQGLG